MTRLPVFIPPQGMVEITARTHRGRCLFPPTPELTERVLGVLGRAQYLYPVDLHSFTFLSNHTHIQATSVEADALTAFESHVLRNTAIIARDVTGWRDRVWAGRTRPIPILDDLAAEQRLQYILANGVKEGLVDSPLDWLGPSSAAALVSGQPIRTTRQVRFGGRKIADVEYPIRLTPLPAWRGLTDLERSARIVEMIENIIASARRDRSGKPSLGMAGVLARDPTEPVELEGTPPPLCHATDDEIRAGHIADRREFHDTHRRASRRFRDSPPAEGFPEHGFLPSAFNRRK